MFISLVNTEWFNNKAFPALYVSIIVYFRLCGTPRNAAYKEQSLFC